MLNSGIGHKEACSQHCEKLFVRYMPSLFYLSSVQIYGGMFSHMQECTKSITTSLIPLETILPEICAFIIGFSCTVWTKMRSLAGSLADGVLPDAI